MFGCIDGNKVRYCLRCLKVSLHDLRNTLSKVVNVTPVKAGHRYPTISGHVDVSLLSECFGLRRGQAGETEHSDLAFDMAPLSGSAVGGGQEIVESITHGDDPVCHELDLRFPLFVKVLVGEDGVGDAGAMEGRIGVHRSDYDLQLTLYAGLLLGIGSDERESANTFTVETHVLREGLGEGDLVTLLNEMAEGEGILSSVSRGETLICHVKEGEELLLLDKVRDFFPLSRGGVDTRGIVGAGVQEDDSALRSILYTRTSIDHHQRGNSIALTLMSSFNPAKSNPTVFLSKYLYWRTSRPESRKIGVWLPQDGVGR